MNRLTRSNFLAFLFILFSTASSFTYVYGQTKPCVFCRITSGEIQQSQVVYRDKSVVGFMDYAPNNPGHVLVVPLIHAREIHEMPDSTTRNMLSVARRITIAIKKTDIKAEAFRLQMNSGEAAGQEVFHCHLHVIPRYAGEILNTQNVKALTSELDEIAGKIRGALKQ